MKLLHINLHKPVTAKVPFFAVVDQQLHAEASKLRWLTTGENPRPLRSFYSKELGRPVTQSLARWVWFQVHGKEATFVGHRDGDLLNCTADNLVQLPYAHGGRYANTGKCLGLFSDNETDARAYRCAASLPIGGQKITTGRPLPGTAEQHAKLRELRAGQCKDMSAARFNAEVVAEELGKKLSWRGLQTLLSS